MLTANLSLTCAGTETRADADIAKVLTMDEARFKKKFRCAF
jgi:hypothetical protein